MASQRAERLGDLLLQFISQLLSREISDPRIRLVTLTGAKVRKDLKHAWIYFAAADGLREETLAGLQHAGGFIRSKIAKELKLRYVPTIEFTYDDSLDRAQRIDELLRQAQKTD